MSPETLAAFGACIVAVLSGAGNVYLLLAKQKRQDDRDDFRLVIEHLQNHVAVQDKRIDELELGLAEARRERDDCRRDYAELKDKMNQIESRMQ